MARDFLWLYRGSYDDAGFWAPDLSRMVVGKELPGKRRLCAGH